MDASGKRVVVAIMVFAAVLASIAYFGKPVVRLKPQSPTVHPVLAVLPFENLDGADELEVIAADTTVSVIEAIESLGTFDVIRRTRVLDYAGIPGGAQAIAEELGAGYVLAGSIERDGDRLRLQAYLVMPGERPRIWADEFFFDEDEAEQIPSELARAIRDALAGSTKPGGRSRMGTGDWRLTTGYASTFSSTMRPSKSDTLRSAYSA